MTTKESVPQVNGPEEPIPDKGDDCIMTDYIPPTKRKHYSGHRLFKRVKSYNGNTIGQETVGLGSYVDNATKSTLFKRSFHIILGSYYKNDPQQRTSTIRTVSDNLLMYCQVVVKK